MGLFCSGIGTLSTRRNTRGRPACMCEQKRVYKQAEYWWRVGSAAGESFSFFFYG